VADDTRERLLRAAAEVFAEKGFAAATVREICTRADANVALINYYFGDKLELYTQVLQDAVAADPPRALESYGSTPEDALRAMITTMLEKATEAQGRSSLRYRLMMHEFGHPSEATVRMIEITMRPVYDKLRGLVSEILGLPPTHDKTRLCVHSLLGQVAHFAYAGPVMAALWPQMKMTPRQREMIAEHIAESMLAYLRTEVPASRR
jgi:AcrR family transcriptional regulator